MKRVTPQMRDFTERLIKDIREYVITDQGVVVIRPRSTGYDALTTGIPTRTGPRRAQTGPRRAQEDETAPAPKAKK